MMITNERWRLSFAKLLPAQFSRFGLRYQHDRDPTLLGWIGSPESQDTETASVAGPTRLPELSSVRSFWGTGVEKLSIDEKEFGNDSE
jgi:hypothetical protein